MLRLLTLRGFKSLTDVSAEPSRRPVLFGPNAAGRSNVLDGSQALSRVATERTLADALSAPIRGRQIEVMLLGSGHRRSSGDPRR